MLTALITKAIPTHKHMILISLPFQLSFQPNQNIASDPLQKEHQVGQSCCLARVQVTPQLAHQTICSTSRHTQTKIIPPPYISSYPIYNHVVISITGIKSGHYSTFKTVLFSMLKQHLVDIFSCKQQCL